MPYHCFSKDVAMVSLNFIQCQIKKLIKNETFKSNSLVQLSQMMYKTALTELTSSNLLCWCVLAHLVWFGVHWSSKNCNKNFQNDSMFPWKWQYIRYSTTMEASVLIFYQFDTENVNPKFVKILSTMESKCTSKRWH